MTFQQRIIYWQFGSHDFVIIYFWNIFNNDDTHFADISTE